MSQPTPNLAPFSCLFVHGPSDMGVYDLDHFQAANDEKDDLAARPSVRADVTYCPSSLEEFASHGASASVVLFLTGEILDELRHSDVKALRKMHQNGMPIAVAGDGQTLRKLLNVKTSQPHKKSTKKDSKKQNAPSDTTLYVTHHPKGQPGSELHFSGQNLTDTLRNLHVASTIQELHINHHRNVVGPRPMGSGGSGRYSWSSERKQSWPVER